VLQTLGNHSKLEPEFLDKIIQKPIPLPPAEQRDIDRFLLFSDPPGPNAHRSAIDHLLDELQIHPKRRKEFDDKFAFFYQTVVRRLFRTMRHAKRYINTLRATLPSIGNEINLFDFFLLEVLHVFYPNVYKDVWSNPWFYLPSWSQDVILIYPFALITNEDEKYRLKREHIDTLIAGDPRKEIVQRMLEELFFIEVKNAFRPHGRVTHDNTRETYLAEQRLTHPQCFPRYFLFRVPAGELPDDTIERLIHGWNSAADPEILVYKDLAGYKESRQIAPLLKKLRIFRKLIFAKPVEAIVDAICRVASELSDTPTDLWDTERYRAQRFLLSLIEDCANPEDVERIVQDVVRKANSFPFLVSFVDECARGTSGEYFHIYEKVNIVSLRKLASARLSEHFIQGKRDIFADLSEAEGVHVLYYWATTWRTDAKDNRQIVQNYVLDLIDRKPEHLGALLSGFTSQHTSASGKHSTFDYEGFKRAFDPVVFHGRLLQHGDAALTTPTAREFAKVCRERFESEAPK
jgi:KAP family P-loop domain